MKKQALISVFDKAGVVEFAKGLIDLDYQILSTGGTFATLKQAGLSVMEVSEITNFPEILGGRVKTLTPQVHGGILARRGEKTDMETIATLSIDPIDVVAVNLYPFFDKVGEEGLTFAEKIEFIDIGGPTMLRSAAKNFQDVAVVCDPADYQAVLAGLRGGALAMDIRQNLAAKVFNLTSAYDAAVQKFLDPGLFPDYYTVSYRKKADLRYGENPHQSAAYYVDTVDPGALGSFDQLHGKALSYNNLRDLEVAWQMVSAFPDQAFCVALKHNTPCGAAVGKTVEEAFDLAFACDPVSIFGGIVGIGGRVDQATASKMSEIFLEIVAAEEFSPEALAILTKKKNLRLLLMKKKANPQVSFSKIDGGLLVQSEDTQLLSGTEVVTQKNDLDRYKNDVIFGMKIVQFVKSNAIVVVKNGATLGLGGGQVNRIWPTKDALARASQVLGSDDLSGAVLVSDAFFPFADCVEEAHRYGIEMIAQPGGSQNDGLSIDVCDRYGMTMVLTGVRHFRH